MKPSYFKLTERAAKNFAATYGTPLLILSERQIQDNYYYLKHYLPRMNVHYAVKANPHERIIKTLAELGACFDVASDGEIKYVRSLGICPTGLVYANPVKTRSGFAACRAEGVNKFTFDSESEIKKMAREVPGGTVLLRVRMDNTKALVNLNIKFGAPAKDALNLLKKAKNSGLDMAGLSFHVGSQCLSSEDYLEAVKVCRQIFDDAGREGINLHILDIGGGFPIPINNEIFDISGMLKDINAALDEYFPNTEIWSEPGRFICGTAVNLLTSVIGTRQRDGQPWYFLDEGLYGTFSGIIFDHWNFELETFKTGNMHAATFAGPSCDSIDILVRDKMTVPLEYEDLILVPNCGAYTSASATVFNGFSKARYVIFENA